MQKILYQNAITLYESETGQQFDSTKMEAFFREKNMLVQPRFVCPKCFLVESHPNCPLPTNL